MSETHRSKAELKLREGQQPEINKQAFQNQRERILVASGQRSPELILKNATFVNVFTNELNKGDIAIHKGIIVGIGNYSSRQHHSEEETIGYHESSDETSEDNAQASYDPQNNVEITKVIDCTHKIICPGFIDGHIHIESSMLAPCEFAAAVVPHGTTAVITDPHEIANVAGTKGIDYMLESTVGLPLDVFIMLPSCVPATSMDESGAVLGAEQLEDYFNNDRVLGLAELMNFYGTIQADEDILKKIALAKKYNKRIDGHAPGLSGNDLNGYITAGVASDHECGCAKEAIEKINRGQWIMIREGTAAKNMDSLMPLFQAPYWNRCMLVTDDKHPGELLRLGHMDYLIRKAIQNGADPVRAIIMATKQPAEYFGLKNRGAIAPGYEADFLILDDLHKVHVKEVYKAGKLVAQDHKLMEPYRSELRKEKHVERVNHSFHMKKLTPKNLLINENGNAMRVIELIPDVLLTREIVLPYIVPGINIEQDIIKLAVVERHHNTGHVGIGFLKGYGIRSGAVASSIAHDSHNLIIAGTNEEDMCLAANCVRKNQGGIAIANQGKIVGELPLPIGGLMCHEKAKYVDEILTDMKNTCRNLGVPLSIDPFMTLAFISLPVIPEIRLTSLGLVIVHSQEIKKTIFSRSFSEII